MALTIKDIAGLFYFLKTPASQNKTGQYNDAGGMSLNNLLLGVNRSHTDNIGDLPLKHRSIKIDNPVKSQLDKPLRVIRIRNQITSATDQSSLTQVEEQLKKLVTSDEELARLYALLEQRKKILDK